MSDLTGEKEASQAEVRTSGDDLAPLRDDRFATALEELEQLLSQRHRAFLLGAGCSKCAGLPLMDGLTSGTFEKLETGTASRAILDGLAKQFEGEGTTNIEDYMSELVDLMAIAERRSQRQSANDTVLLGGEAYAHEELLAAYSAIKAAIRDCIQKPGLDLAQHRVFVRAVHRTLLSGKTGRNHPTDFLLLNYDTLVEDALALECIRYADGFEGGATGWWSPEVFDAKGLEARVLKLHGGIDWRLLKDVALPRRIRYGVSVEGEEDPVLIWPAATKYRETQRDPYAQVVTILRNALRPTENNEVVLGVVGYAFGDSHINLEVEAALRESQGRLTCVVFSGEERPTGVLGQWVADAAISQQIRVYAQGGFFHGNDKRAGTSDLPWWKFEVLARLLGGER